MMLCCENCGYFFTEGNAKTRQAELEDGMPPGTRIVVCPWCGEESIYEAGQCEMCGEPLRPGETLCDDCEKTLDVLTERLLAEVCKDQSKAREIYFDYLERKWF